MIYYRKPQDPQKRGARSNCYICYYCESGTDCPLIPASGTSFALDHDLETSFLRMEA